jgi:nitrogen regulatory protein P-II 2
MHSQTLKLVTIVAESVLTEPLLAHLKSLGATGYTITDARGEGSRGRRVGELPGDNQRIEVLAGPALADRILDLLAVQYFPNYAIVAWVSDVVVVRGEKYVAP